MEYSSQSFDSIFKSNKWLLATDTNVSIKSRSLSVLFRLTKKYPELKKELKLSLEDLMDKHSKEFKKKAVKIITELVGKNSY